MALPPSRRDVTGPPPRNVSDLGSIVRHHDAWQRRFALGGLGGRFGTPSPVLDKESQLVGGDAGGDGTDDLQAWDSDQVTATVAGTVTLHLTYEPIENGLIVFWDGDRLLPTEYTLDGQTVTFTNSHIHVGDNLSAWYLYLADDSDVLEMVLRGITGPITEPTLLALPAGTELGDLIVVANATMHYNGTAGGGAPSDSRLTQVGHGAWVGIATTLAPIAFVDPLAYDVDRHTASIATFAVPAAYKNDADVGPGSGPTGSLTAPVVAATAAILVITEENPNSFTSPANTVPAGYTMAVDPDGSGGAMICRTGIWYWTDPDAASSPAGSIAYTCHVSGFAYATTIGIQGDS